MAAGSWWAACAYERHMYAYTCNAVFLFAQLVPVQTSALVSRPKVQITRPSHKVLFPWHKAALLISYLHRTYWRFYTICFHFRKYAATCAQTVYYHKYL